MDMDLEINIDTLIEDNIKMDKEIERLTQKIEANIKLIQQNCKHDYITHHSYGERPSYQCRICSVYI